MQAVGFAEQLHDKIRFLVAQKREGMALVHDLRAEHREHLVLEIGFPAALLLFVQMGKIHLLVAVVRQLLHQVQVILVALGLQLRHAGHDGRQLLRGGHVGHQVGLVVLQQRLVVQRAHPDHKKLVQVAAVDAGKLEALAQRHRLFLGKGQHAAVKVQPAELPVDKDGIVRFQNGSLLLLCDARMPPWAAGRAAPAGLVFLRCRRGAYSPTVTRPPHCSTIRSEMPLTSASSSTAAKGPWLSR